MPKNYFEEYEQLLTTGGAPDAELDAFTIESINHNIRRARFSQGPILNIEVRQRIDTDQPNDVLVDLSFTSRWMGLYLAYKDGFVTCQTGGMFAVKPDGTFDNRFGLSEIDHGPLTLACQGALMEIGLGFLATSLAVPS